MSIIPDLVLAIVKTYLAELLVWLSDQTYTELLKRDPDHLLIKLAQHLNFGPLEMACAAYHHATGPGVNPTHPVPRLVRALLVGSLYHWSLRELEWHIRFNLVVKWFVGYPIFALGPDHSTLERFELWVCFKQHRAYFDEILCQIDADFPDQRQAVQIGDTYALCANAAKESLVPLIRHTCRRLLAALRKADAARELAVRTQLDLTALWGAKDEPSEFRLMPTERACRLQRTVLAAQDCIRWVRSQLDGPTGLLPASRTTVLEWLTYLEKIIADEVCVVRLSVEPMGESAIPPPVSTAKASDPPAPPASSPLPDQEPLGASQPQVTRRATHPKGSYRLGSATDPEATYRVHGSDKMDFGYNVNVAVTDHFVREVHTDTGAQPDAVAIPDMLRDEGEYHHGVPPKFIYDSAAGAGKTRARVSAATNGQTQLVAHLPPSPPTEHFTPDRFRLLAEGRTLVCPHGQTTTIAYRSSRDEGLDFRFLAAHCRDCPLWTQCRTQKPGSKGIRYVYVSDYRGEVEAAQVYNRSADFRADMRHRPLVERIIAALVRYNGARSARRRGMFRCDFQARMNAMAYNLKKWMHLLRSQEASGSTRVV